MFKVTYFQFNTSKKSKQLEWFFIIYVANNVCNVAEQQTKSASNPCHPL